MSTAEAVNVAIAASLEARYLGDGTVTAGQVARQVGGVALKGDEEDARRLRHYVDNVVRERARSDARWKDFSRRRATCGGSPARRVDAAPPRLRQAAHDLALLRERDGVHLVGVRHHSPACAVAVAALVAEVRPSVVLVEGPEEYTRLLPALLDERTVPPVAVLSLAGDPADAAEAARGPRASTRSRGTRRSGSRCARATRRGGARVRRLPVGSGRPRRTTSGRPPRAPSSAERHLAYSRTVARLAERLGCRDHDELWTTSSRRARRRACRTGASSSTTCSRGPRSHGSTTRRRRSPPTARSTARRACPRASRSTRRARTGRSSSSRGVPHARPRGGARRERARRGGRGAAPCGRVRRARRGPRVARPLRRRAARRPAGYGAGMPAPGYYDRLWSAHHDAAGPAAAATGVLVDVGRGASERGRS